MKYLALVITWRERIEAYTFPSLAKAQAWKAMEMGEREAKAVYLYRLIAPDDEGDGDGEEAQALAADACLTRISSGG